MSSSDDAAEAPVGEPEVGGAHLADVLDRVTDLIACLDTDLVVTYVNRSAASFMGVAPEDLIGRSFLELFPRLAGTSYERALREAIKTQQFRELRGNSAAYGISYSLRIFPSPDELTLYVLDTSESRKAHQALVDAEARSTRLRRLATVLAATNEAVFRARSSAELFEAATNVAVESGGFTVAWIATVSEDRSRVDLNTAAPPGTDHFLAQWDRDLPGDPTRRGPFREAVLTGQPALITDMRTVPDGAPWREAAIERGYLSVGSFPLLVDDQVRGVLVVCSGEPGFFDQPEEVQLMERMASSLAFGWESQRREAKLAAAAARREQSQRLESLGRLAGGIAHDFNNLLGVILNYVTLLERRGPGTQESSDLAEIRSAADRGARLTRQLLTFARQEPLHLGPLDVNAVVRGVASMLKRTLGPRVQLLLELEEPPPQALADRTQLEQILLNLAINARDAMPEGGTLKIETTTSRADGEPPTVVIGVTDSGSGMSEEVAERAFEPFFTTKARAEGSGLGLANVHAIVDRSGGSVCIDSEEGVGTRLTVRLRAPEDAETLAAETTDSGSHLSSGSSPSPP